MMLLVATDLSGSSRRRPRRHGLELLYCRAEKFVGSTGDLQRVRVKWKTFLHEGELQSSRNHGEGSRLENWRTIARALSLENIPEPKRALEERAAPVRPLLQEKYSRPLVNNADESSRHLQRPREKLFQCRFS